VWQENFDSMAAWDQVGQGTLPDGIQVWDAGNVLRTLTGSGNASAQSLVWRGGGTSAVASSATMTLPFIIDNTRDVQVTFSAYSAVGTSIDILVSRAGCPTVNETISASGWTSYLATLPKCSGGKIVFQVGNVYPYPTAGMALKVDDLKIYYQ
jgi:hypothetical protein